VVELAAAPAVPTFETVVASKKAIPFTAAGGGSASWVTT
jgi:hypothetical protein